LSTTAEQQRPSTKFELTATGKSIVSAFSCSTFGDIHGNVLVAGSDDGNVYSWCEDNKQQSQKRLKIFSVNKNHPIRSVCYYNSTIGKPILAACSDNIVKLWSPSLVQPLLPSRSL
jgi:WD40 repeat protein